MTPEREKYLKTCSREEMAIRDQIEYTKFQIWRIKGYLNADWRSKDKADEANAKKGLHSRQRAIKALKRQLPTTVKERFTFPPSCRSYECANCGEWIASSVTVRKIFTKKKPRYCPWCGQKQKWEE